MAGEYNEPAIQLLHHEDGTKVIRFAAYKNGRFQRSPLMIHTEDLAGLAASLKRSPRLRALLASLLGESPQARR